MELYLWLKAAHIVAVISWMVGLLYLPRLFVYHASEKPGSAVSKKFKIMEHKLLRFIMTPAMIITFIFGIAIIQQYPAYYMTEKWIHAKFSFVLLLAAYHGFCASTVKKFARDENTKSEKFYRITNEIPTVLMIAIVFLVVLKPF